jgi:hypothetical protein
LWLRAHTDVTGKHRFSHPFQSIEEGAAKIKAQKEREPCGRQLSLSFVDFRKLLWGYR